MVNKICRRTFFLKNTLWADEAIAYGEDILWSNLAALACESYITSDAVLYNYRQRKNSVSGLKNVEKNAERRLADSVAITERYYKLYNTQKNPAKRKKLSRLYRIHTERAMLLFAGCKGKKLRPAQFLPVLKEKGLYPFCPVGFQLIPCSDLKTTLCNWLTFGFFFRPYFFLSAGACSLNKRCRRAKPPPGAFMCFHGGFFMSCRGSAALQQIKANRCFFGERPEVVVSSNFSHRNLSVLEILYTHCI